MEIKFTKSQYYIDALLKYGRRNRKVVQESSAGVEWTGAWRTKPRRQHQRSLGKVFKVRILECKAL
jgi:hypothetical protein